MEIFRTLGKEVSRRKLLTATTGGVILFGVGGRIYDELQKPQEIELEALFATPDKYTNRLIATQGYKGKTYYHTSEASIDLVIPAISITTTYTLHKEPDVTSPSFEVKTANGVYPLGKQNTASRTNQVFEATLNRIQVEGVFKKGGNPNNVFYYIDSLNKGGVININQ